ncbi:kinase-like domain-containing protein [Rhizophagus clarus]|uniref:Kinase-like domain-containing protein n=1 Tax=Rhizophagus clarus TaxID=94130 RepID=A0A8H3QIB0_9GLOM|nr:kinase-like domain-containing protein [Rhizophagus clarus]
MKKILWIPYNNFNDITYINEINEDGYLNYSARLKSKPKRIKDIKIILKELINSEKMTQEDLKLTAVEFEYNDKRNVTEILGISQNPITLNYVIVVDFLFSGQL